MKYSVVRNSHPEMGVWIDRLESTGLDLETARKVEEALTAAETAAKPLATSWTADIFYLCREDSDKWHDLVEAGAAGVTTRAKVRKLKPKPVVPVSTQAELFG
jgi:hypothetical protein